MVLTKTCYYTNKDYVINLMENNPRFPRGDPPWRLNDTPRWGWGRGWDI